MMGLITSKYLKVTVTAQDAREAKDVLDSESKHWKIPGYKLHEFFISPAESSDGSYVYYSKVVKRFGTNLANRARSDFR